MFQPRFQYSEKIVKNLMAIEKSKAIVEVMRIPYHIETRLKNKARLKMTHFSTQIEGNPFSLEQVEYTVFYKPDRSKLQAEQEVRNYWEALSFLDESKRKNVLPNEDFIKKLHAIIDNRGSGRRPKKSQYRSPTPPGVLFSVFDSVTKRPEYIPPEATDVPMLMEAFTEWLLEEKEMPVPIKAAIASYQLLTIHPFEDGNGRTARALATYILALNGYDLRGFNSMEEYYMADLEGYYRNIQMGLPVLYYDGRNNPENMAPWIEYFLTIMATAFEQISLEAKKTIEEMDIIQEFEFLTKKDITLLKYMLKRYSKEIRPKEIAELFGVTPRAVLKWMPDWLERGVLQPTSGKERIRSYRLGEAVEKISLMDMGYIEETRAQFRV